MALSEKVELLGKGLYDGQIPDEITIKSIPTGSELDYIGAEDFDKTMLNEILPACIEEDINPRLLLEIDYQWVLRCLRFLNYGPYVNVGAIFCDKCGTTSRGDYIANLSTVGCKTLPEGFVNSLTVSKDEFIDFNKDITFKLPTISRVLASREDKQFKDAFGHTNRRFARMCYMITAIGTEKMDPVAIRTYLQKNMSSADFLLLQDKMSELDDYGLRAGGTIKCPKCGNEDAAFPAFVDERLFRPTVGALRRWRDDKCGRAGKDLSRNAKQSVR